MPTLEERPLPTAPPAISFDRTGYDDAMLRELYEGLLLPRMIEEKMLILLRQGKVSKWFSGIGQEAIAVGSTMALDPRDYILPLHRNLGVFTARKLPLERLFLQWQGKQRGYTRARDRSFHFGDTEHRVIGMISHLGAMLGVADGLALAGRLDGDDTIALVYSGDGGASQGDFHEAINVAAVWKLPVIFLVENNGYGLSTPSCDQFNCSQFVDKAIGYGIEGVKVDGNNILEVHGAVRRIAGRMRADSRPVLLEAITFRMRGHEEASGIDYVPRDLLDSWRVKDPVTNFERFLLDEGVIDEGAIKRIRWTIAARIDRAVEAMLSEPEPVADVEEELRDVYALGMPELVNPDAGTTSELRLVDAVSQGLRQGLRHDPRLVIMGQDIAEYGGVFKVTEGFLEEFGRDRIRNTPLCESAIVGAALGLSIAGRASVVEMQFADFVSTTFNQIANNLAKTHYRWDQPVNVTVRMPTGAGVGAGPFHSQSTEAWFTHIPGLKVVYPSTPYDAKGLLTSSLLDPNPVLFFEHKYLYRSIRGAVPESYYNLPIGAAATIMTGEEATIVTYGLGVHWAREIVAAMPDRSIEIIDLRTLLPWDRETVLASVRRTGRCLVVHEDTLTGGFGAEIAAVISEECFGDLDAPVMRVGSLDTPVPFSRVLEDQFMGKGRVRPALERLLRY